MKLSVSFVSLQIQLKRWLSEGEVCKGTINSELSLEGKTGVLLLGSAKNKDGKEFNAPCVISENTLEFISDSRVFIHSN